jgi:hypothetical protein
VKFDSDALKKAKGLKPSEALDPRDAWAGRVRQAETRYVFDRGPGREIAGRLMGALDRDAIFEPKPGMKKFDKKGKDITFETHGIDAYYSKTHPGTGFFGFHRGSFETAKALILADPEGLDDWNTSRALTGARGQHLNGLMQDLGFREEYLVLKTVPFGMDGASAEEWEEIRRRTEGYREVAIKSALENPKLEFIFTDGEVAKAEMQRILAKLGVTDKTVISIRRKASDPKSGLRDAGLEARRLFPGMGSGRLKARAMDIPRSHLPWWARLWEGTGGGDSVIEALGSFRGGVRAVVTPNWVARQKVEPSEDVKRSIARIRAVFEANGIRMDREPLPGFLERKGIQDGGSFLRIEKERRKKFGPVPEYPASNGCPELLKAQLKG